MKKDDEVKLVERDVYGSIVRCITKKDLDLEFVEKQKTGLYDGEESPEKFIQICEICGDQGALVERDVYGPIVLCKVCQENN